MLFLLSCLRLAWLNLTHRPLRFVVYLAGVGFAVLLMFVQLGFWCAMLDSSVGLVECLNADLVIFNKAKYSLSTTEPFELRHLIQARAAPGVDHVTPFYVTARAWKRPATRSPWYPLEPPVPSRYYIRVLAYEPSSDALLIPEVIAQSRQLEQPGTALLDTRSSKEFGSPRAGMAAELDDHAIKIIGTFTLGTDFVYKGNLILSRQTYTRLFLAQTPDLLDWPELGLVVVKKGTDPRRVRDVLQKTLAPDVEILTRDGYADLERAYWEESTPVGFVFALGLGVGLFVGGIICYQILATDIHDNLAEYATLKAIGYPNGFLIGVVLQQSLVLSLLGFVVGGLLSVPIYRLLENWTGLPMLITLGRSSGILILTVIMCALSGWLAIGPVVRTDPAEVFR